MKNNDLYLLVCNERFLKYYLRVHFEFFQLISACSFAWSQLLQDYGRPI